MHSALALALVIALGGTLVVPATSVPDGSLADRVMELRMQIDRIVRDIAAIRDALVTSISGWWSEGLSQVTHALDPTDLAPILESLAAAMAQLPPELRTGLQGLTNRLLTLSVPDRDPGSTATSLRTAVAVDPRFREEERRSVGRQATAVSYVALTEAVQHATDQVADALAHSMATVEATGRAGEDAQSLQSNVAGAQSSRALLQYLGEGLADLMRQHSAFSGILAQHLTALSQQDALATRDLELVVSLLAQDILAQEQARHGQVAARQEALRLLAEGYSHSLFAVGSSLLELHSGTQERRHQVLDAITPTW